MRSDPRIEAKLKEFVSKGFLETRTERNPYLKLSYKGTGNLISPKWNVKIYTSGSLVCNDPKVLEDMLTGNFDHPDLNLSLLQVDDAGVGFPLLGVMVGITDGKIVRTGIVDVSYFKTPQFQRKEYLDIYAKTGMEIILGDFKATTKTHRIEICTGFINTVLKDRLREYGFDVRVTEIKGLLQDSLEGLFKEYVKKATGVDQAYDVKLLRKEEISDTYYKVLAWGRQYAPHLLKTGWKSI